MGIGNPSLRHPESPVQVKILEGKGGKTHLWFVGKRKGRGKSEETWGSKRFIYTKQWGGHLASNDKAVSRCEVVTALCDII